MNIGALGEGKVGDGRWSNSELAVVRTESRGGALNTAFRGLSSMLRSTAQTSRAPLLILSDSAKGEGRTMEFSGECRSNLDSAGGGPLMSGELNRWRSRRLLRKTMKSSQIMGTKTTTPSTGPRIIPSFAPLIDPLSVEGAGEAVGDAVEVKITVLAGAVVDGNVARLVVVGVIEAISIATVTLVDTLLGTTVSPDAGALGKVAPDTTTPSGSPTVLSPMILTLEE